MYDKVKKYLPAIIYVGLIYITLPYVPKLWFLVKNKIGPFLNWGVNFSCIFFILIWIFNGIKKTKQVRLSLGSKILLFFSIILYILLFLNLKLLIERIHLIEYGFLSYLIWPVWTDKIVKLKKFFLTLIIVCLIGLGDELLQRITPGRIYDIKDIITNWLSGFIGLIWVSIIKG